MNKIIQVRDVNKSFGGVVANLNISMDVEEGKITGLIGPNGSGKTTLFNSIVGYHPIDSGTIHFENREISNLRVQKIARLGVLRTFQQTRIYSKIEYFHPCHGACLLYVHRMLTFSISIFQKYQETNRIYTKIE